MVRELQTMRCGWNAKGVVDVIGVGCICRSSYQSGRIPHSSFGAPEPQKAGLRTTSTNEYVTAVHCFHSLTCHFLSPYFIPHYRIACFVVLFSRCDCSLPKSSRSRRSRRWPPPWPAARARRRSGQRESPATRSTTRSSSPRSSTTDSRARFPR